MEKKEVADFMLSNHRYNEKQFSKKFSEHYYDMMSVGFPKEFTFRQKLYHWIHDDFDLKLGICPVCGKRCTFESLNYGYKHHCSTRCSTLDKDVKKKRQATCFEKYGVSHESKNESIKHKKEETCYAHFGVRYPQQNEIVRNRLKENNIKKYGVPYIMQADVVKAKIKDTCLKKYGVPYVCMSECARRYSNDSKPNLLFENTLTENGIWYEREFCLDNYSYDFKVGNDLIEVNPTITHNSHISIYRGRPKDASYHLNKSICAEKYGYQCIHVWDWDSQYKIINMLKTKTTLYARNLKITNVSERDCNIFLQEHHLQNMCKLQNIRYGLYMDDTLVEVMTFGKPRYNKNYEWELLRLCTHSDYIVVGGAERLFRHFVKEHNPKSVISYCDNSKFNGNVYERLGFAKKSVSNPTRHWYNLKTKRHITDNFLRQRGFDQLFGTDYGKGTSNEELMLEYGFLPVYDCGQTTFIWSCETLPN